MPDTFPIYSAVKAFLFDLNPVAKPSSNQLYFIFCGGSGRTRIVTNLKSLLKDLLSAVRACMNCLKRNHRWIPLRCNTFFLDEKPNKQFNFKTPKKRRQQLYFILWQQYKNTIIINLTEMQRIVGWSWNMNKSVTKQKSKALESYFWKFCRSRTQETSI